MQIDKVTDVERYGSSAQAKRRRIERIQFPLTKHLTYFSRRRSKAQLPFRVGAAFLFVIALRSTTPIKAAEADSSDLGGFELPTNWGALPSPTSEVHLRTPTGLFKLPLGYYSVWWELKKQQEKYADDGDREFAGGLAFSFVYPGGEMTSNAPWNYHVKDRFGRFAQGKTAVFIDSVHTPNPNQKDLIELPITLHVANSLVRSDNFSVLNQEALSGFSTQSQYKHRFSVKLTCVVNCSIDIYDDENDIVLSGFMDGGYRDQGLLIADQALTLLDRWKSNA